jgi:hypothetical protein
MPLRRTACALSLFLIACQRPDPILRERIVERDQLRREVAGFRALEKAAPGKIMDRGHEVLITLSDTLLQSLLEASLPVSVPIRAGLTVTLMHTTVVFRANVARVDITGFVRRAAFPQLNATMHLRGALDSFIVDSTHALKARVTIDDVTLGTPVGTPVGAPDALVPYIIEMVQRIVEGSLPELSDGLPALTVPVRLDDNMALPGFGPEGMLSIAPSRAPMQVDVRRVIAFQNRIWIVLGVRVGAFASSPAGVK